MSPEELELIEFVSENWGLIKLIPLFVWIPPLLFFIFAWVKTKTKPFQIPDDELFARAFGKEVKR